MAQNGTTKDLKKLLIVINDYTIPVTDLFESPEIQLPQNLVEVVGGNNAGGFEFKVNNNVDGQMTINFFQRGQAFETFQSMYLNSEPITIYAKDGNTQMIYANGGETYFSNVSAYKLGASEAMEVTILMPDFRHSKA